MKQAELSAYLNGEACAELIAEVTVSPTRGQERLFDRVKGYVKLSGTVHMRTRSLHTLQSHTSHGIRIYGEGEREGFSISDSQRILLVCICLWCSQTFLGNDTLVKQRQQVTHQAVTVNVSWCGLDL